MFNPWTEEENTRFLEALAFYGNSDMKPIVAHMGGTRTPTQVRTHMQKYLLRMKREAYLLTTAVPPCRDTTPNKKVIAYVELD